MNVIKSKKKEAYKLMNNYLMNEIMRAGKAVKSAVKRAGMREGKSMTGTLLGRHEGSAVIGEVLVMIVVVAMAAIFKSGGLEFIRSIWTTMTQTAATMFS